MRQYFSRDGRSKTDQQAKSSGPAAKPAPAPLFDAGVNLLNIPLYPVQPKLMVGPAMDRFEQQADAVAERVASELESPSPNQAAPSITPLSQSSGSLGVQRDTEPTAGQDGASGARDQAHLGKEGGPLTPSVEQQIAGLSGGGSPLAEEVRAPLEQSFGIDLGHVRVHTDGQADSLNRSLQARAFTTNRDIFFRHGEYDPHSHRGRRLLAHELTHTVQQAGLTGLGQRMVVQRTWVREYDDEIGTIFRNSETNEVQQDTPQELIESDKQLAQQLLGPYLKTHCIGDWLTGEKKYKKHSGTTQRTKGFLDKGSLNAARSALPENQQDSADLHELAASPEFWMAKGDVYGGDETAYAKFKDKIPLWCDEATSIAINKLAGNPNFHSRLDIIAEGDPAKGGHWYVLANKSPQRKKGPSTKQLYEGEFVIDIWGALHTDKDSVIFDSLEDLNEIMVNDQKVALGFDKRGWEVLMSNRKKYKLGSKNVGNNQSFPAVVPA